MFHHTPEQAAGIAKARAILRGDYDTVLAQLQSGDYVDDAPVTLARPSHTERITCSVALELGAAPDLSPKWVQVATAGVYKGYAGGAFTFDAGTFTQIVNNFRSNPSFGTDLNGIGNQDVIPWDFNHASAAFAADGSIPLTGTPAQGWVQDLKVVAGQDGVAQLFALTNWLEPARTYITENRYRWASVVVGFDCRDPKTNQNIGAVLESIALTNNPFIEGMQKLAADRAGGPSHQSPTGVTPMKTVLSLTLPPGIKLGSPEAKEHARVALSAIKLAAGKAEIGGRPGTPSDLDGQSPNWTPLTEIPQSRFNTIMNQCRSAGFSGGTPAATCLAFLRAMGADVVQELGLDDGNRAAVVVGHILMTLGAESQSSGDAPGARNLSPVIDLIPTPLSRQPIDARNFPGTAHQRAIAACRAASPKFAAAPWDEQVHAVTLALRDGRVVA